MTTETIADFATDGAQLFKGALKLSMRELEAALSTLPQDEAGLRLHGNDALKPLFAVDGCIGSVAASVLGDAVRPVRAILFNKSPETNWSLGWHQDRTICVTQKREAPGFGPWTVKRGMTHVAPPFDLLTRMVTVRAHLDSLRPDRTSGAGSQLAKSIRSLSIAAPPRALPRLEMSGSTLRQSFMRRSQLWFRRAGECFK
jgi:hypothetical protein